MLFINGCVHKSDLGFPRSELQWLTKKEVATSSQDGKWVGNTLSICLSGCTLKQKKENLGFCSSVSFNFSLCLVKTLMKMCHFKQWMHIVYMWMCSSFAVHQNCPWMLFAFLLRLWASTFWQHIREVKRFWCHEHNKRCLYRPTYLLKTYVGYLYHMHQSQPQGPVRSLTNEMVYKSKLAWCGKVLFLGPP